MSPAEFYEWQNPPSSFNETKQRQIQMMRAVQHDLESRARQAAGKAPEELKLTQYDRDLLAGMKVGV